MKTSTVFVNFNGELINESKVVISPNNRSFRYGDGFFETIKVYKGKILLSDFHVERLFSSLAKLQFEAPTYYTVDYFINQIELTVQKNGHSNLARVRLTVFRGNGGLYDPDNHFPHFIIQSWPLNDANNLLNENGLVIDVYPEATKSCDAFSHIKSNNYLSYAMAALWAKKNHLNDALVLNANGNIADATIASIFMVKDGIIYTPPLSEGPVSGNMRKYLLKNCNSIGLQIQESAISINMLAAADEIFLTNAIYGIRWVKMFGNILILKHTTAMKLHQQLILPLLHI